MENTVFNTEMHLVTAILVEIVLFGIQLIFYLLRPTERKRQYFLILLFLLICYNMANWLFPGDGIKTSIVIQGILAGFLNCCLFPFYSYKAFDIQELRFHAKYGVFIFLVPYFLIFAILYPVIGDINLVLNLGLSIAFCYAAYLTFITYKSIKKDSSSYSGDSILVFIATIPWFLLPMLSYAGGYQIMEVILTNVGFLIIALIFFRNMILESVRDSNDLLEFKRKELLSESEPEMINRTEIPERDIVLENCTGLNFTPREINISQRICEGAKNKQIAEHLFISERTVTTHLQNIYKKASVSNRVELANKLKDPDFLDHFEPEIEQKNTNVYSYK